ncbi:hypothetical protein [Pseudomonas sp. NPDC008258]|uniref:hypothetical protein n=1 Tax=Pseudomonas sp. NPDC008258 TaxID=3364418 RepID=UPI0036EA3488
MSSDNKDITKFELNNKYVSTMPYAEGLSEALNALAPHLSIGEREDLCFKKLGLTSDAIAEQSYIQSAVELTVCAHYARFYPEFFIYEEKVNPPKDVDCSVRVGKYKFNLEVKCADFRKKEAVDGSEGFKIGSLGRMDDYPELVGKLRELFETGGHQLSEQRHMDNNMKEFLVSAHEKFSNSTSDTELNVLIVGCDDAMDMQKWHSYLYGAQGLFTVDSYVDRGAYQKVDMVVLTNLYHRHKDPAAKDKLSGHWRLSEAFCLLCANPESAKPFETLNEFSGTLRHYTNELNEYMAGDDEPDFILKGIGIPAFVGSQLQAKGNYYFQPYPAKGELNDAAAT